MNNIPSCFPVFSPQIYTETSSYMKRRNKTLRLSKSRPTETVGRLLILLWCFAVPASFTRHGILCLLDGKLRNAFGVVSEDGWNLLLGNDHIAALGVLAEQVDRVKLALGGADAASDALVLVHDGGSAAILNSTPKSLRTSISALRTSFSSRKLGTPVTSMPPGTGFLSNTVTLTKPANAR